VTTAEAQLLEDDPSDIPIYVAQDRYVNAYRARRLYFEQEQTPPAVFGVKDAIDIHCHANEGQQDPVAIAKLASSAGMKGILFKTIVGAQRTDVVGPASLVREFEGPLEEWCNTEGVEPIKMWAGYATARGKKPPSAARTRVQLEDGVVSIWMPIATSVNSLHKVGMPIGSEDALEHTPPLPWDEAMRIGHYTLDEKGELKREIKEIFRLIADFNVAVSFSHATHRELFAMADIVRDLGIKKAYIDHPFSPFVNLTLEEMRQFTSEGIYLNFTFDEISPLLGVDPSLMCKTIQAVGTHHVTISSDCGEPLFPNSVEGIRLLRGYMQAYGLTAEQIQEISVINPEKIVGMRD